MLNYADVPAKVEELFVKLAKDTRLYWPDRLVVLDSDCGPVMIVKQADVPADSPPNWVAEPKLFWRGFGNVSRFMGGPNPIASAIVGGALSAALGYGIGRVGSKLLPKKRFPRRDRLAKIMSVLGGLGGATAFGLGHGLPLVASQGWRGWFDPGPFNKQGSDRSDVVRRSLMYLYAVSGISDDDCRELRRNMEKSGQASAGTVLPSIPVNQFNQMVLTDPLTPWPARASVAGLVQGASQAKGNSPFVSPMDIGRVAVGMGSGYLSGMLVGKALGALAGMAPDTQDKLKQTGAWAGFIKNVAPIAFGGR